MTLNEYVHQVLVEENPYIDCVDLRDRYITYDNSAFLIADDILKKKDHPENIVRHWLSKEFGEDHINVIKLKRIISRVNMMVSDSHVKESFKHE